MDHSVLGVPRGRKHGAARPDRRRAGKTGQVHFAAGMLFAALDTSRAASQDSKSLWRRDGIVVEACGGDGRRRTAARHDPPTRCNSVLPDGVGGQPRLVPSKDRCPKLPHRFLCFALLASASIGPMAGAMTTGAKAASTCSFPLHPARCPSAPLWT